MQKHGNFRGRIEEELIKLQLNDYPPELYEPIRYFLGIGGKRIRPVFTLTACEMFGTDPWLAMNPALGLEIFHNFTLLHDDIMDNASLRRSSQTVHLKWNRDIAILSGDAMFVKAFQLISSVDPGHMKPIIDLFTKTAIEVCEGQQLDMNFEHCNHISTDQYIDMISKKTSVLIGCCLETGAIIANASVSDREHIYRFGLNLGIAFQLRDDYLDAYGIPEKFGKKTGGDILSDKKTFLWLKAYEQASASDRKNLDRLAGNVSEEQEQSKKISDTLDIFNRLKIPDQLKEAEHQYFSLAMQHLDIIDQPETKKTVIRKLADSLFTREA
jgi:geranylgeranyl diphosphate synthase, type II